MNSPSAGQFDSFRALPKHLDQAKRPSLIRSPSMPAVAQFKDDKVIATRQALPRLRSLPKVVTLKDLNIQLDTLPRFGSGLRNGFQAKDASPASAMSSPSSAVSPLPLSPFSDGGAETDITTPTLSISCGRGREIEVPRMPSLAVWELSDTEVSPASSRRYSQDTVVESIRSIVSNEYDFEEEEEGEEAQVQPSFQYILPDPIEGTSSSPKTEVLVLSKEKPVTIKKRVAQYLDRHFHLTTDSPEIVLPYPPTDKEKLCYLDTKRWVVVSIGVFSFCATMAGFWLFSLAASFFIWFVVLTTFLQGHIILSYILGIFSKDFDYEGHLKILKANPITVDSALTVDILLPVCKEPLEVLENTWKYVAKLRYPSQKLKVFVLDDGALDSVKEMAARFGFEYIVRDDRPRLCKAGNLRWAFQRTEGQLFVIFDADFVPRDDFLLEVVPRMLNNPNVALVQTPQFFRTEINHTWVERGAGEVQELFYRWGQTNRNKWNASICVGSNATYRREALIEVGGTAEVGASEDVHTGFNLVTRGHRLEYVPICLAAGICPDEPRQFFNQQVRWCQGSTSLLFSKQFWSAKLTLAQRACYLSGMLYYSSAAVNVFLVPLPGILLMWFRPSQLKYYNLAFAIPSILLGVIFWQFWSATNHSISVQQVRVIQSYSYISGLKDRLIGASMTWIATGTKNRKNERYRNARLLAIAWTSIVEGFFISGCAYRMLPVGGSVAWWNFFPLIILNAFNLYISLPFLLSP